MNTLTKELGQRIRSFRTEKGMTQEALAEKAGLHPTYVGQVERGEKNLTIITLGHLTGALDITLQQLFSGIEVSTSQTDDIYDKCYQLLRQHSQEKVLHIYAILLELFAMQE